MGKRKRKERSPRFPSVPMESNTSLLSATLPHLALFYAIALVAIPSSYHLNTLKFGMAAIWVPVLAAARLFRPFEEEGEKVCCVNAVLFGGLLLFYGYQFVVSLLPVSLNYEHEFYVSSFALMIAWSLLVSLSFRTERHLKVALYLVPLLLLALGVMGVLEYLHTGKAIKLGFGHKNYLGGFLVGTILLASPALVISLARSPKRALDWAMAGLFATCLAGGLVCLGLANARGSFAATAVAASIYVFILAYILILEPRRGRGRRFVVGFWVALAGLCLAGLALLAGLVHFGFPQLEKRLLDAIQAPAWALGPRTIAWKVSWDLWGRSPIFGNGLGSLYPHSFTWMPVYFRVHCFTPGFKHAHNDYLEILQDSGLLGLGFYLFLMVFTLGRLLKVVSDKGRPLSLRVTAGAVFSGLLGMMANAAIDVAPRMAVTQAAFFFLLGLASALILMEPRGNAHAQNGCLWNKGAIGVGRKGMRLLAGGLLCICILPSALYILTIYWPSEYYMYKAVVTTDPGQRLAFLDKAVEKNEKNIYARYQRMKEYLALLGDKISFERFLGEASRIEEIAPGYYRTPMYMAMGHLKKGDIRQAVTELERQLSQDYYFVPPYYYMLRVYYLTRDEAMFRKTLKRVVERDLRFWLAAENKIFSEDIQIRWERKDASQCRVEIARRRSASVEVPLPLLHRTVKSIFSQGKGDLALLYRDAMEHFYDECAVPPSIKRKIMAQSSRQGRILKTAS